MRLLLVSIDYPPEVSSTAHLMAELAEELVVRGHDVTVLTYPPEFKLDKSQACLHYPESMLQNRVQVLRIAAMPQHNVDFIRRGIATLVSPLQLWKGLERNNATQFDACFIYSTPITFSFIGGWLKKLGTRFIFNVQDIFPQNAIDLGILTNSVAIAMYRWIERRAYRIADVVTAHSEGNRRQLAAAHPEIAHKLVILHNWIDDSQFVSGPPKEDFRQEFGLEGKFVGVYGGVIGLAQGLDIVVDVAERVRDLEDLVFVVVGEGSEAKRLEDRVVALGLHNIVFRPFVSRDRYPSLLRSFDFGFLTLSPKMKTPVVPGKLMGYMAAGLPVVAFVNAESDAHTMMADAKCGYSCNSDDPDAGAVLMRKIYADRMAFAAMGESGCNYVARHFSKKVLVGEVEALCAGENRRARNITELEGTAG